MRRNPVGIFGIHAGEDVNAFGQKRRSSMLSSIC